MPQKAAERRPGVGTVPRRNNSAAPTLPASAVILTAARPTITPAPDPAAFSLASVPDVLSASLAVDPQTGEWIWVGSLDQDGYGRHGGQGAHRLVYVATVGPIPDGYEVDHVKAWGCTSRACCSPWHLEAVTQRENVIRSDSFAGINARKITCDHGHLYTEANTYRWGGRRDCRACIRRRVAEHRRRKQGAGATDTALAPAGLARFGRAA